VPTVSATYTVTGTDAAGCTNTATATVDGNRIFGNITIGGSSTSLKVWLIQFDPTDSSITALDSTMACLASGTPYFEFMDKAPGNYMAKAVLTTAIPGTSDYIPTYSNSTILWYAAATAAHTTMANNLDISMIYGTVPSGPGFIGGYVYAGAGRGTTGDVPVNGMIIFLKNAATGTIVTYTYTDATGAYSFNGLALGNYVIYPEQFDNHTIPSATISVTSAATVSTGNNFRRYNDSRIIKPVTPAGIVLQTGRTGLNVYPNPTTGMVNMEWNNLKADVANVVITDVLGREVYSSSMSINTPSGLTQMDLTALGSGVYFINVKSADLNYSNKLIIAK
jgi:hypothetical protein